MRSAPGNEPQPRIGLVSLIVPDYEAALAFYVGVLGFQVVEDVEVPEQAKRWVVVSLPGGGGAQLLLARAANEHQATRVGDQTGGRVFLFLYTEDFERDHELLRARGVAFVREPTRFAYGTVAVFRDPFGNLWDLIEPAGPPDAAFGPRSSQP